MDDIKRRNTDGIRPQASIRRRVSPEPVLIEQKAEKPEEYPNEPEEDRSRHQSFIEKYAEKSSEGFVVTDSLSPVERRFAFPWVWKWSFLGGGIFLMLVAGLLSTVLARVTVVVKPRVENIVLKDISVAFDASVSKVLLPQKVLPAERLEFPKSLIEEFEATGTKNIEEKARGKVQLYNSYSSSPQSLVENTRLLTDKGVLYRLTKTMVIPGAEIQEGKIVPKFVETEVVADKVGEESNYTGEIKLNIPGFKGTPKYEGFYAVVPSGFAGGFRGEARVVSRQDLQKAQESLSKKLYDELKAEIVRKTPHDFLLIDALREIQITKIDAPKENTRRDKFPVEVKGIGRLIVFREKDVKDLVKEVLSSEKGKELVEDSINLQYRVRNIDFAKGRAEAVLSGEVKLRSVVPLDEIAGMLVGKKEGSIIEALKGRQELTSFQVAFFPPWIFSSPKNQAKIKLIVDKE